MSESPPSPPEHVLAAFGARASEPESADGRVWRCGDIVLRPAVHPAEAAWVAQTLGELHVADLRIGRPLRASDGRWVVGGWVASRFIEGGPQARYDEIVAASLRLHKATRDLPRPRFLSLRVDAFALADRLAWDEEEIPLNADLGGDLFSRLAGSRRQVTLRSQVVHGDLFGNVLFVGDATPGINDFIAYFRPAEWAAGVVVVDALAWGGADTDLPKRWSHLPEWPQMLLRALLFRVAGHALHPGSTEQSLRGLERAAHQVVELL